jgi:hypothetical protein
MLTGVGMSVFEFIDVVRLCSCGTCIVLGVISEVIISCWCV